MKIKYVRYALILSIVSLFCLGLGVSFYQPSSDLDKNSRLVVILGAGYLKDGTPVLALEKRLDKGIEVWNSLKKENNNILFFISGHQEEVEVMYNYLITKEIPPQFIIQDNTGYNTMATIKNSYKQALLYNTTPTFISQAYHIPRITLYAFVYGKVSHNKRISYVVTDRVEIPFYFLLYSSAREVLAMISFPYFYLTHR